MNGLPMGMKRFKFFLVGLVDLVDQKQQWGRMIIDLLKHFFVPDGSGFGFDHIKQNVCVFQGRGNKAHHLSL